MLNHAEAVRLNQDLVDQKVLSVYLNAEETDPAERRAWRLRLNGMVKQLEDDLASAPEPERRAAHAAAARIGEALDAHDGFLPGRGWVGFATPDRLWHAGPSPAPMPDLVRWEDGAHVAPYVRALKQSRPVTAVVADSRRVRIFRYQYDELREEGVIWSDATITDSSSAGSSNRASTRSGARGEPRGDAARRGEEVSTQRMLREALDALSQPVSDGHLIVVAGTSETTAAFVRALPERARERTIDVSGVPVEASPAALKEAIETAASALSLRLQQGLVKEILEATRSAGRACVGREQTERALQAGAVDTLVFSRAFARAQPDLAERFVDRALEQGATVEEIPEAVANELDGEGGVGARLRFTA